MTDAPRSDPAAHLPPAEEGLPLFAKVVGGFLTGSLAVALGLTLGPRLLTGWSPADPREAEALRMALMCDVGGTLVGSAVLFAVLGTILGRSPYPMRARGVLRAVVTGMAYQLIPLLVTFAAGRLDPSPAVVRAVLAGVWLFYFFAPALVAGSLITRGRAPG